MEYVAIILVCGLFADIMLMKSKTKHLEERVDELERLVRHEPETTC
jgi:hypothetical protein